tara:strand:+ start:988 stop:1293 length:306 start_codon:yes stop_codon:yes gene_type:complete
MKITRKILKNMIKEEAEKPQTPQKKRVEKDNEEDNPNLKGIEYTPYEQEDLTSDQKMVILLEEILSQLKVLNMSMTKAKSFGASDLEKAIAARSVAESEEK